MIIKRDIYYPPAQQMRTLHIWLPDGYFDTDERYPVMYMFDGHNLYSNEDATYGKSWGFGEFLPDWSKQIIMVGMECSHEGHARLSEYCPYNKRMFGHVIKGLGEETYQWIINDIKPMIDAEYRTWPHREATGIGGASMGGIMSIYGGIAHNDVFSKAACLSSGTIRYEANLRKELAACSIDPDTKMYFAWGENEMGGMNDDPLQGRNECGAVYRLARRLGGFGADSLIYFQQNGNHCEADWEKQVPRFMDYLWNNMRYE